MIALTTPVTVALPPDGTVIKENIELKDRPDPRTSWPFSQANPKPEEE